VVVKWAFFPLGRPWRTCCGETFELLVASPLDEVLAVTRVFRYLLLGLIPAVLAMASLAQLPHI
jgi:hypothetical protein